MAQPEAGRDLVEGLEPVEDHLRGGSLGAAGVRTAQNVMRCETSLSDSSSRYEEQSELSLTVWKFSVPRIFPGRERQRIPTQPLCHMAS